MKVTKMYREIRKARNKKKMDLILNNKVRIRIIKKQEKTESKKTDKNQKKSHQMRVKSQLKTKTKILLFPKNYSNKNN
jgi:hypothetical protein